MVTGVPRDRDIESVLSIYSQSPTTLSDDSLSEIYAELQAHIIAKKKLYIFYEAEVGKTCNSNNNLLKEINKNSQYWHRDYIPSKEEVDMKDINLSIVSYV
jgi:hypothetical protein